MVAIYDEINLAENGSLLKSNLFFRSFNFFLTVYKCCPFFAEQNAFVSCANNVLETLHQGLKLAPENDFC